MTSAAVVLATLFISTGAAASTLPQTGLCAASTRALVMAAAQPVPTLPSRKEDAVAMRAEYEAYARDALQAFERHHASCGLYEDGREALAMASLLHQLAELYMETPGPTDTAAVDEPHHRVRALRSRARAMRRLAGWRATRRYARSQRSPSERPDAADAPTPHDPSDEGLR